MIKYFSERISISRGHAVGVTLLAVGYGAAVAIKLFMESGPALVGWYIVGTVVWAGVSVGMFYRRTKQ